MKKKTKKEEELVEEQRFANHFNQKSNSCFGIVNCLVCNVQWISILNGFSFILCMGSCLKENFTCTNKYDHLATWGLTAVEFWLWQSKTEIQLHKTKDKSKQEAKKRFNRRYEKETHFGFRDWAILNFKLQILFPKKKKTTRNLKNYKR